MSWTPENASALESIFDKTDFWEEFNSVQPKLGGRDNEERLANANKREEWEEVVTHLKGMSRAETQEPEEDDFVDVGKLDPK